MTRHGNPRTGPWVPPDSLRRWYRVYILVGGLLALAWVLLRTGTKPSRLAYPCQQAALSTATLALGASLVGVVTWFGSVGLSKWTASQLGFCWVVHILSVYRSMLYNPLNPPCQGDLVPSKPVRGIGQ